MKKGRRRKKRLKGNMDMCQGRLVADYDFSDFEANADKMEYLCSKCHNEIKNCKCWEKIKWQEIEVHKINGDKYKGASNSRVVVDVVC
jgi:hypothetical protein